MGDDINHIREFKSLDVKEERIRRVRELLVVMLEKDLDNILIAYEEKTSDKKGLMNIRNYGLGDKDICFIGQHCIDYSMNKDNWIEDD